MPGKIEEKPKKADKKDKTSKEDGEKKKVKKDASVKDKNDPEKKATKDLKKDKNPEKKKSTKKEKEATKQPSKPVPRQPPVRSIFFGSLPFYSHLLDLYIC